MKLSRKLSAVLVLAALGATAQAQSELVFVGGEAGYIAKAVAPSTLTRGEVTAQLARSLAAGQTTVQGEAGGVLGTNGLAPSDVALAAVTVHPSRAQVKADTREAIRTGDFVVAGEAGLKANQLYPRQYAPVRAQVSANSGNTATAAGY